MQAALVRIEEPKDTWCRDLARHFPRVEIEVLTITSQPGRSCVETILLRGNQLDEAVGFLSDHDHVRGVETIGEHEGAIQIRLHLGPCPVADLIPLIGVAPRTPFRARAGKDLWFLIGPPSAVEEAWHRIRDEGLEAKIIRNASWPGIEGRLTENQRRVLDAAVAAGYYDYPRKITLSAMAARIGVAKSTLSESLMVIEKKVMTQYSDETTGDRENDPQATTNSA